MTHSEMRKIRDVAAQDFRVIQKSIRQRLPEARTSLARMDFKATAKGVTASCNYNVDGRTVTASINYRDAGDEIYADNLEDVTATVLSSLGATIITAADGDEAFDFDADAESFEDSFDNISDDPGAGAEDTADDEYAADELADPEAEMEDPQEDAHIQPDNNISGHYIAECDRCHNVFISALVESDQTVQSLQGVCPLCEKESEQYIKWVIKPVEF